jgi:hypothetical protein
MLAFDLHIITSLKLNKSCLSCFKSLYEKKVVHVTPKDNRIIRLSLHKHWYLLYELWGLVKMIS